MEQIERDYYQDMIINAIKRIDRVDLLIFINRFVHNIMRKEKIE